MSTAQATNPQYLALIYARVSEGEGSIEDQIRELTEWANDEGWSIGRIINEGDRSASPYATREREGFNELLKIIEEPNRPESILLTWEPSRLSRISEQIHYLTNVMAKHNLLWGYDESVYDMRKTRDKAKVRHDGVDSEKESDQISDRVTRHMRGAAADGKPHGRMPYGYRREYERADKKLIVHQLIDEEKASLVREMARRFLSGESLRAIAKDFERRQIPTSTGSDSYGWQAYMIRRILMNPSINGKRVHKGKAFSDARWPSIVDDVTFARLQARFSDPARKTIRQRERTHILTGVARCGICGGPLGFAAKHYKDGTERAIYSCRMGNHVARYQKPLEQMVVEALLRLVSERNITQDDLAPELARAREQIDDYQAKIASLTELMGNGELDPVEFANATKGLRTRIAETQRSITVANLPTVAIELAESDNPRAYWETLDDAPEKQRELLRATLQVIVHPVTNRGSHKFDRESIEIRPV